MNLRSAAVISFLLLFLWSCGESSLFLTGAEDDVAVAVYFELDDGVVEPGSRVGLTLDRDPRYQGNSQSADSVRVELFSADGDLLATQRYDSVDQATRLPDVRLPELEEGLYTITATYLDGDEIISSVSEPLFMVTGSYRIVGLASYPATSYPDADMLVSISLDIPADANPFLVWYVNGEVERKGYLTETRQTIAVAAPEAEGIFPVKVDLYPVWHSTADSEEIEAPVSYTSEIFVSRTPAPLPTDFGPSDEYFMLYNFRGLLHDSGARQTIAPDDYTAEAFGNPMLSARDNAFGYYLEGRSGFVIPGFPWPLHEGGLSPVTLSFRLVADRLTQRTTLFSGRLGDDTTIRAVLDAEGRVGVELPGTQTLWTDTAALLTGVTTELKISLIPQGEQILVEFHADGMPIGRAIGQLPDDLTTAVERSGNSSEWGTLSGESTLGAESGGFVGIIDEFGVYFRDADGRPAADDSAYLATLAERTEHDLIYAESFSRGVNWSRAEFSDDATWAEGAALLPVGSEFVLPSIEFSPGRYRVAISASGPAALWLSTGARAADETRSLIPVAVGQAQIQIEVTESSFRFVVEDNEVSITRDPESAGAYRLHFEVAGAPDDALVLSEVVVSRVPDAAASLPDEE